MFKKFFGSKTSVEIADTLVRQTAQPVQIPAGPFRFLAVDVETANTDVGSICQIGIACVDDADHIQTMEHLVDPQTTFDSMNIEVHGIRHDHVKGQPNFQKIWDLFGPLLKENLLVQHSSFDSRAIRRACEIHGINDPDLTWHDSVRIARRAWPEFKGNGGHGLGHLKKALKLNFQHHNAGEDARAAAEIVLKAEAQTGKKFQELAKPSPKKTKWQPSISMEGSADGPLFGQVAVFTGALSMSRPEAAKIAAKAGIEIKAGVSKKVTLLIVGDQDLNTLANGETKSSKHRKAEELIALGQDIRILGETHFLELVNA